MLLPARESPWGGGGVGLPLTSDLVLLGFLWVVFCQMSFFHGKSTSCSHKVNNSEALWNSSNRVTSAIVSL